jgi:hypothetical protein
VRAVRERVRAANGGGAVHRAAVTFDVGA